MLSFVEFNIEGEKKQAQSEPAYNMSFCVKLLVGDAQLIIGLERIDESQGIFNICCPGISPNELRYNEIGEKYYEECTNHSFWLSEFLE